MKKIIMAILIVLLLSVVTVEGTEFPSINSDVVKSEDVIALINATVPSDVLNAFLYATSDPDVSYQNTLRMYLLAVGKKESEWKYTQSHKANADGTYDLGYLMLNENNLDDKIFQRYFMPKEGEFEITNFQEFLIITCINFYRYLYDKYDCDACYAYNAGERRYLENRLPDTTYKYKADILDNLNYYLEELTYIVINRKVYESDILRIEREEKINELINNPVQYIYKFNPGMKPLLSLCEYVQVIITNHKIVIIARDPTEEINKKLSRKSIIFIFDDDDVVLMKTKFIEDGKVVDDLLKKYKSYTIYI